MILYLTVVLVGQVNSYIISRDRVKLKPDKHNVVEYKINPRPFGFLAKANLTITVTCEDELTLFPFQPTIKQQYPTLDLRTCPRGVHDVEQQELTGHGCGTLKQQFDSKKSLHKIWWHYTVPDDRFLVLVLKENRHKKKEEICSISAMFLNPGGRHLSSDQLMIPTNTICVIVTWIFLAFLWLINYICFRKYSNKLHQFLTFIIIFKLVNSVLAFIYWTELNDKGRIRLQIQVPFMLCTSLFQTMVLVLLMLAGEGWCIVWERPRLLKYYLILSGFFFLNDLCFKYVHKYFQGFAIVNASMMIYIAFKCSTISINTIRRNLTASNHFIENHNLSYNTEKTLKERLNKKLRMFNYLQGLIIGLPCVLIVVESVASFLLVYNEWVRVLLVELLKVAVVTYCCCLFRLQDFSEYNNITLKAPRREIVVLFTPYKGIVYISSVKERGVKERDVPDRETDL